MFANSDKIKYYIRVCQEGAAFAKSEEARQAWREALMALRGEPENKGE